MLSSALLLAWSAAESMETGAEVVDTYWSRECQCSAFIDICVWTKASASLSSCILQ